MRALGRDDLDDVAVLELVVERHEPVVDLRADAAVADVGVDAVGEVERRGARRQFLDVAFRREDEDLVLEDVELHALDELGRVGDVPLPIDQLAQPGELCVVLLVDAAALLVAPVGRDADLRDAVHLVRSDLHLERLAVERHHRRMERLVEVVLGHGDVVVELPRDRPPERVDDAQCRIAIAHVVDQHAQRVQVVDLAELGALANHLSVDGVDVLGPSGDLGFDSRFVERLAQHVHRPADEGLARASVRLQLSREGSILLGLEDLERQVLQLPLELPDAQPLGQRRVDLGGLARDALLLLDGQRAQRAHVVEPVSELDQDHADVVRHGQEHLADVLGLLLLVGEGAELGQLGDAVDQLGDLGAELLLEIVDRVVGVLRDVVEERRLDRCPVQTELGQDLRHGQWVGDVRLAADPSLQLVRTARERVGLVHLGQVRACVVARELRLELALLGVEGTRREADGDGETAPRRRPTRRVGSQGLNGHPRQSVAWGPGRPTSGAFAAGA